MQHPTFQYEVRGQGGVVLATVDARSSGRAWIEFPQGRTWLLLQGSSDGPVVGEIGARDKARRLSVRAGKYFARGRGPDVLVEGTVSAAAGESVAVQEATLERIAYARLVRKGGGALTASTSLEAEGRLRSSLASDSGVCAGAAVGVAIALRAFTLTPRLAWCRSGFAGPAIDATVDQYDFEVSGTHVWDVGVVSIQVGLTVGGSLLTQSFHTQGVAPRRTTAALQLAPTVGLSRDVGNRTYLFLLCSGSTYLLRTQDPATAQSTFGPSFAVRTAAGVGFRL
jgi:hypothetical protein